MSLPAPDPHHPQKQFLSLYFLANNEEDKIIFLLKVRTFPGFKMKDLGIQFWGKEMRALRGKQCPYLKKVCITPSFLGIIMNYILEMCI